MTLTSTALLTACVSLCALCFVVISTHPLQAAPNMSLSITVSDSHQRGQHDRGQHRVQQNKGQQNRDQQDKGQQDKGQQDSEGQLDRGQRDRGGCVAVDSGLCTGSIWTRGVALPNVYGHSSVDQALEQLRAAWDSLPAGKSSDHVTQFLCTLFLPPCPHHRHPNNHHNHVHVGMGTDADADVDADNSRHESLSPHLHPPPSRLPLPLPCRPLCEVARQDVLGPTVGASQSQSSTRGGKRGNLGGGWPSDFRCELFPTEQCYTMAGPGEVQYVLHSLLASGAGANMADLTPQAVTSLEGADDDVTEVSVTSWSVPPRRYDLHDLGDPLFFRGWADVQGSGAANDYCRVVGKGKRRFLSCALAGTRGQQHHYVSTLGFDPGHNGTWFMRDVDNDGRDDYCRCTGDAVSSGVWCMKAGDRGFYGSTLQGGSQFTFQLPATRHCLHTPRNPQHGV